MTQAQAVIETIDKLGGIATLNQINQHIFEIEDCAWKTKTILRDPNLIMIKCLNIIQTMH